MCRNTYHFGDAASVRLVYQFGRLYHVGCITLCQAFLIIGIICLQKPAIGFVPNRTDRLFSLVANVVGSYTQRRIVPMYRDQAGKLHERKDAHRESMLPRG